MQPFGNPNLSAVNHLETWHHYMFVIGTRLSVCVEYVPKDASTLLNITLDMQVFHALGSAQKLELW